MRLVTWYEFRVPNWALSYLVNGDSSGLTVEDVEMVDRWFAPFVKEAGDCKGIANFSPGEDAGFAAHPAFGLACDCSHAVIQILN